jgi:putative toxin-antitoxin system antitoxin component (TIGR02293 family)
MDHSLSQEAESVAATDLDDPAARELRLFRQSHQLLGGEGVFSARLTNRLAVHQAIVESVLPYASLQCLITALPSLDERDVIKVLGISDRTLRRQRETPMKPMPATLASKTWLFAETLAKASEVFGSQEKAEEWLNKPAMGLDGQRPIELLQTVQGTELVNDFLTRLEYGVYS